MTDTKMCPYCGEEVKLEAIKCKHCQSMLSAEDDALVGAAAPPPARQAAQAAPKVKKPIWKRWWAWAVVIVVLFLFIASSGGEDKSTPSSSAPSSSQSTAQSEETPAPEPMIVTVDDLVNDLRDNALKASNTYKDQYVELTGRLSNIDSDGKYFSLGILSSEFSLNTVLCRIDKSHLDTVMNFSKDQQVTVTGKITAVGEVLGYTLQVETIK